MARIGWKRNRRHDCLNHGPLLPQDVLAKSFRVHKLTVGYDPDEVDDYLDGVAASMAGYAPPLTSWDIRQHEFTNQKRLGAFSPDDVDDFLECIARTLEGTTGTAPVIDG